MYRPVGQRKNPLVRVKVGSPPQRPAGSKGGPSKRLRERRKRTQRAPEGYYANPVAPMDRRGAQESHLFIYLVEFWMANAGAWQVVAGFDKAEEATNYAYAYAKQYPARTVRVVDNFK